jgi:hypothetical protein
MSRWTLAIIILVLLILFGLPFGVVGLAAGVAVGVVLGAAIVRVAAQNGGVTTTHNPSGGCPG